jgi:hypothetical protein
MRSHWLIVPAALAASTSGYETIYLTLDQAQAAIFPGASFKPALVTLTPAQRTAIAKASGVHVRTAEVRAWRVSGGAWFFVDQVIGKHEFITYALGLDANGDYFVNKVHMTKEAAEAELTSKYATRTSDKILFFKADVNLKYHKVQEAIEVGRRAGARVLMAIVERTGGLMGDDKPKGK